MVSSHQLLANPLRVFSRPSIASLLSRHRERPTRQGIHSIAGGCPFRPSGRNQFVFTSVLILRRRLMPTMIAPVPQIKAKQRGASTASMTLPALVIASNPRSERGETSRFATTSPGVPFKKPNWYAMPSAFN
jgi:hypothetical protein